MRIFAHFLRNSLFQGVRRNFYFLLLRYEIFITLTINWLYFYVYFTTVPTLSVSGSYSTSASYFCDSLVINNPDFVVMKDENGNDIKLGANNQYTKHINMGGYHKMYFKASLGLPLDFIRCNCNLAVSGSVQKIPGMINDEKVPINRDWFQIAGRLDSNISKKIVRYKIVKISVDFQSGFIPLYQTFS